MERACLWVAGWLLAAPIACGGGDFTSAGGSGGAATSGSTPDAVAVGIGGGPDASTGVGAADACGVDSVCVPEVKNGPWTGPAEVYVGNTPPDACGPLWTHPTTAFAGEPLAPEATCDSCVCGPVTDAACTPPVVEVYSSTTCGSGAMQVTLNDSGVCTALASSKSSAKITTPAGVVGGSCAPSGGTPTTMPPTWSGKALVCEAAQGGSPCGEGGVCAPKPLPPFRARLCVYADGDLGCPAGYPDKTVFHTGLVDSRSCTKCSCDDPTNVNCTAAVEAFTEECLVQGTGKLIGMQCSNVTVSPWKSLLFVGTAGGGQCTAGGGESVGSVEADGPITACCEGPG